MSDYDVSKIRNAAANGMDAALTLGKRMDRIRVVQAEAREAGVSEEEIVAAFTEGSKGRHTGFLLLDLFSKRALDGQKK